MQLGHKKRISKCPGENPNHQKSIWPNFILNNVRQTFPYNDSSENIKIPTSCRSKVTSEIIDQIFHAILRLIAKDLTFTL